MLKFDVATALAAAHEDRIEEWVHLYLNSAGRNPAFSDGLRRRDRFWRGPVEVRLDLLERTCGPEPGLAYPVPVESWARTIASLSAGFETIEAFPPLIVQYESGRLLIRDGNHRYGAFQSLDLKKCRAIIWYADEAQWEHHAGYGFQI